MQQDVAQSPSVLLLFSFLLCCTYLPRLIYPKENKKHTMWPAQWCVSERNERMREIFPHARYREKNYCCGSRERVRDNLVRQRRPRRKLPSVRGFSHVSYSDFVVRYCIPIRIPWRTWHTERTKTAEFSSAFPFHLHQGKSFCEWNLSLSFAEVAKNPEGTTECSRSFLLPHVFEPPLRLCADA